MTSIPCADTLTLYGKTLASRVLLGTSRYPSLQSLSDSIAAARPGMVTLALRRQMNAGTAEAGFFELLKQHRVPLLPNTAGCQTVAEAVTTAQMAREIFDTDWIKLELIGDDYTLQPDPIGLVEAAALLVKDGFKVLPYCTEDLVIGRRLLDAGCEVLMPWGAPIGTGKGIVNPYGLRVLRERLPDVPLIVDAGLGVPSHACQVMEWGFDGVLLNTAVSQATHPEIMARAFALGVDAGRAAYLAGQMEPREAAQASTPVVGMPFWHQDGGRV
ncbi:MULTISPECIES: thiazole synthase [Burkholderia]|uniref:Thiazole synthase n=1 Tax=Burkholderia singularis TaxID=1503053 RepID=A0A238H093_9BURK|nr:MULTISPECIES: thiazole synthase [Burkholderia]AOK28537.1 thiazole synthase [Burkholderia sp. Bp7605]SMF98647.1 Thiazole biosynthesis protein ThiG [Burkholderia singularis]